MPHKHKRLKTGDEALFNLPPSASAKGLPVKHASAKTKDEKRKAGRRKEKGYQDDTPRAFAQLMQLRRTGKGYKGLDDGRPKQQQKQKAGDKRKRNQDPEEPPVEDVKPKEELRIKPGERLGDYAARVDQALPVAGLIAKNNKAEGMREQRKTKHEKKLQRLVNNWKADEAKRLEKAEEEWDEAEEEEDETEALWESHQLSATNRKKGKNKKEEDPWAELKKKREKPKGVFDVVQAPPQFTKVPKEFKIRDGAGVKVDGVPNSGSLRRQEMLSETRQDVIKRYREMMQAKRGEA